MTDMQDRIERAARAYEAIFDRTAIWSPEQRREAMGKALTAAFPELFDTPTHWIAPMVATEEMEVAAGTVRWGGLNYTILSTDGAGEVFASMRTAYLNQKDSEGQ